MASGTQLPADASGPRNLPRASHACEQCRTKKAKCDQRQPCSRCVRYQEECRYGLSRRGRRARKPRQDREHAANLPVETAQRVLVASDQGDVASEPPDNYPRQASDGNEIGDLNERTHGIEFYGTSSNYVLLNQLFSFVRSNRRYSQSFNPGGSPMMPLGLQERAGSITHDVLTNDHQNHISVDEPSVVNLLATEEPLIPPPHRDTPSFTQQSRTSQGASQRPNVDRGSHLETTSSSPPLRHGSSTFIDSSQPKQSSQSKPSNRATPPTGSSRYASAISKRRLEQELIRGYLRNLHYLHPMLDSAGFTTRCEVEVWNLNNKARSLTRRKHFIALFNIVVALGALIAGSEVAEEFAQELATLQQGKTQPADASPQVSLRALSRSYFLEARASLGDVFEVRSLESAQTLLLMSVYCQNMLKPHACYMYCGMAVRTALAIGMPTTAMANSLQDTKAARRTWWCIYSHEIDMCCSSGRRDSLKKPQNYPIPFPEIKGSSDAVQTPVQENRTVAMINEMVGLAVLLRRISKELYHNHKSYTLSQRSGIAFDIDALLEDWKNKLPDWLRFDHVSLCEPEWAAKQKLVLHLRYLNTRAILHRPFLTDSSNDAAVDKRTHMELCLAAARETVLVLHESYKTRHYFRTWWYNSTYALYAGMVALYVMMFGESEVSRDDLERDVLQSQSVLRSMEGASVARRSADLLTEVLDVARLRTRLDLSTIHNISGEPQRTNLDDQEPSWHPSAAANDMTGSVFQYAGNSQDPSAMFASITDLDTLLNFTQFMECDLPDESFSFSNADQSMSTW